MAKKATGELIKRANGHAARVPVGAGHERKTFKLAMGLDDTAAGARCTALADLSARLRGAGRDTAEVVKLLALAAEAKPHEWEGTIGAIDAICRGAVTPLGADRVTFLSFAEDWTSGRLHAKHPDHVPEKDNARDAGILRKHVAPIVPEVEIGAFGLEHAEAIMKALPATLAKGTRRHVAQVVHRVLGLAVYPARLRKDNPIPRGWLPHRKDSRAKDFILPAEDRALLAAPRVPLLRRLLWGFLTREGCRVTEATSLRWQDLDLDHGFINLDANKTDDPRRWTLDPGVTLALSAWKKDDAQGDEYVFAVNNVPINCTSNLASLLRKDLRNAGVTRATLFERSDTRQPIRAHDARATFVQLNLAAGRSEQWVMDRTGHRSSAILSRYRRGARTWAELNLGGLDPLHLAIPELGAGSTPGAGSAPPAGGDPHTDPDNQTNRSDEPIAPSNAPKNGVGWEKSVREGEIVDLLVRRRLLRGARQRNEPVLGGRCVIGRKRRRLFVHRGHGG